MGLQSGILLSSEVCMDLGKRLSESLSGFISAGSSVGKVLMLNLFVVLILGFHLSICLNGCCFSDQTDSRTRQLLCQHAWCFCPEPVH